MEKGSSQVEILAVSQCGVEKRVDDLIREEEVVVRIGKETRRFYCIPTDLEAMIVGNLKARGIEPSLSRVRKIVDNEYNVDLSSVKGLIKNPRKCESDKKLTEQEVFSSVKTLNENSFLFQKTGCTHVVGVCGSRQVFVEDVSRHCAIDKAVGLAVKDGIDLSDSLLVTSCRQTASTIKKAIFCGIPVVISVAAPTNLAVREAVEYGITLIGFAGLERFNIYSHHWRIELGNT